VRAASGTAILSTARRLPREVTDNFTSDAAILPFLLIQIPAVEIVANVSGDSAYDTKAVAKRVRKVERRRLSLLASMQSYGMTVTRAPQHVTPSWRPRAGLAGKSGRSVSVYHGRSLVETEMRCFKLLNCLDSWAHVPARSWPLFKARHVLRTLHQPDFSPIFR